MLILSMAVPSVVLLLDLIFSGSKVSLSLGLYSSNLISFELSFVADLLSLMFLTTVLLVSGVVFMYSSSYVLVNFNWFISTLSVFVISMLLLSASDSLFWALLGWDGLGVSSFLLILFYKNNFSLKCGVITFLTNRTGDVFLLLSIGLLLTNTHTDMPLPLLFIAGFITKSAQVPFSAWLPLAMAAPTPVSSLVHSSTLVAAGVYLAIRFNDIISQWSSVLLLISSVTLVYSGVSALFEWDMKKVIALSTLCHLSLMFVMISSGSLIVAQFHMMVHAFFKSMLFMIAGIVIHDSENFQDIRNTSIHLNSKPDLSILLAISLFSMGGLPALSGFYSKELMVQVSTGSNLSAVVLAVTLLGVALTSAYSVRLWKVCSLDRPVSKLLQCSTEWDPMVFPVMLSSVWTVSGGNYLLWLLDSHVEGEASLFSLMSLKALIVVTVMLGVLIGMQVSDSLTPHRTFSSKWALYSLMESTSQLSTRLPRVSSVDSNGWFTYLVKESLDSLWDSLLKSSPILTSHWTRAMKFLVVIMYPLLTLSQM